MKPCFLTMAGFFCAFRRAFQRVKKRGAFEDPPGVINTVYSRDIRRGGTRGQDVPLHCTPGPTLGSTVSRQNDPPSVL